MDTSTPQKRPKIQKNVQSSSKAQPNTTLTQPTSFTFGGVSSKGENTPLRKIARVSAIQHSSNTPIGTTTVAPQLLGKSVIKLTDFSFDLDSIMTPPRCTKLLRAIKTECNQNLRTVKFLDITEGCRKWVIEHELRMGHLPSRSTIQASFQSLMKNFRLQNFASNQIGTREQQKAFLNAFLSNLDKLKVDLPHSPSSSIWSIEMLHMIHQRVLAITIVSRELNHPQAMGLLPNIALVKSDLVTTRASLLTVQFYSGLRPSELYQISLPELRANKQVLKLTKTNGSKIRALVSYSRIKLHKTARLGINRYTAFVLAHSENESLQPTPMARALAYLIKIGRLRISFWSKWECPIPPTKKETTKAKLSPYTSTHLTTALKYFNKKTDSKILQSNLASYSTRRFTVLLLKFIGGTNFQISQVTAWSNMDTLRIYLGQNLLKYRDTLAKVPEEILLQFYLILQSHNLQQIDSLHSPLVSFKLPKQFSELSDSESQQEENHTTYLE